MTNIEEMQQRASVHRHDDFRLRRVRQHITRILFRHAHFREHVVSRPDFFHQRVEFFLVLLFRLRLVFDDLTAELFVCV